MSSFKEDDIDALEQITQEQDQVSDLHIFKNQFYDMWIDVPQSVRERRRKFIQLMGLGPDGLEVENPADFDENHKDCVFKADIDRIIEINRTVLRTSSFEYEFSSSHSSASSWITDDSNSPALENVSRSCPSSDQNFTVGEIEASCYTLRTRDKLKNKWLRKWKAITFMIKSNIRDENISSGQGRKIRRVNVQHCRRKLKELSGLFTGQDIRAHDGSILAMKFSLDGRYLASAGEDMLVKLWKVIEDERDDMSLMVEKEKVSRFKSLGTNPDSTRIIFPPKVFQILEKPLHVFEGHNGEILDLSWSKDNCLLSSSVDSTVRLWRVGFDRCLKVFSHIDYVTCVQFNPVNADYFISGSIDGKVRIWTIHGCQVVHWTETKEIITAVSYRPDGQGGVFGSIGGTCYFFSTSDNHFQLETQMCIASKKKSPCKRITGFQFLPQDPTKVLVTCGDAHVIIIDGLNVIGKYKGFRKAGNQISATFTPDGKHLISASEDSNIYLWNYEDHSPDSSFSQPRVIKSFECFSSEASIALPWCGLQTSQLLETVNSLSFPSTRDFILDGGPRGSATWPEEKLVHLSSPKPPKPSSPWAKSQYKFLMNSRESSTGAHLWGLVIVAAGWDGRIRSFQNYGLPVFV